VIPFAISIIIYASYLASRTTNLPFLLGPGIVALIGTPVAIKLLFSRNRPL
jgi:hypothetical protein